MAARSSRPVTIREAVAVSQHSTHDFSEGKGLAHVVVTDRDMGSFRVDQDDQQGLAERRRAVVDYPWVWLRQIHGSRVVTAESVEVAGAEADAVVTTSAGLALAIHTADCAPVVLLGDTTGIVGAAHAGWRGLADGILEATVGRMTEMGETHISALVGPCICPADYEFGEKELATLTDRLGDEVRGTTGEGSPALDIRAGVRVALARVGVEMTDDVPACTAEEADRYYSYRARRDSGRQAMVVWRELT